MPPYGDGHCINRGAVVKFKIDATQECCIATLGPFVPLPVEWKHFNCMAVFDRDPVHPIHFDCIRGKLFYVRFEEKKKRVLVVMDVE